MTVTLALPKGRIFEETMPFLQAAGIQVLEDPDTSRKLILATNQAHVRVVLVRATDVPTYVSYGGADMGVVGLDTLIEHGGEGMYQPLDLQIARCRMSVAVRQGFDYAQAVKQGSRLRVATKYTAIARQFFAQKGCMWTSSSSTAAWSWRPSRGWPTRLWTWSRRAAPSRPTNWSRSSTSWTSARAWWSTKLRSNSRWPTSAP